MPVALTDIAVFKIAETRINEEATRNWLDHVGAIDYPYDGPDDDLTDSECLVGNAGKRCYMSFEPGLNPNVTKVRRDWTEYFANIFKSGHGSVLEHASYSFAIEGITRVGTGELNRHRLSGISEGSMRYIRFLPEWIKCLVCNGRGQSAIDRNPCRGCRGTGRVAASGTGIPYWLPTSLREDDNDEMNFARQKEKSREILHQAFSDMEYSYQAFMDVWATEMEPTSKFAMKKKLTSMFRRIVGMGVATGGVWTWNIRALRHILTMRATSHAEEEIFYIASKIAALMLSEQPRMFGDFVQDEQGYWSPKYVKV